MAELLHLISGEVRKNVIPLIASTERECWTAVTWIHACIPGIPWKQTDSYYCLHTLKAADAILESVQRGKNSLSIHTTN